MAFGLVTGQVAITTTGTLQQLPSSGSTNLQFSTIFTALSTNSAPIVINTYPAGSPLITGAGTGYILAAGASIAIASISNTNSIWISGTSTNVLSWVAQ